MGDDTALFSIVCEGLVIGHSQFEQRGLPRGVLRGSFAPSRDYESVRALFRADALARIRPQDPDGETVLRAHYRTRDQLSFEVVDASGDVVPVEYVHIYEPVLPEGAYDVVARLAVLAPGSRKRSKWFTSRPDA